MPARSKPLPCEAGIQVKREQGTLAESLETANYKFKKKHYKYLLF